MLVSRIRIENVRSFLEPAELRLDGPLSIVIGPNGGGKTNLLDTLFVTLRRYLFASMYAVHAPHTDKPNRHQFQHNDALNHMSLDPHTSATGQDQVVIIDLEVTEKDITNMEAIRRDAPNLMELASEKYDNANLEISQNWEIENIQPGQVLTFKILNGNVHTNDMPARHFMEYLQKFEIDALLRQEYGLGELTLPLLYLPVNRASQGFQSGVELASHNAYESKRHTDAMTSRQPANIVNLAIGQLTQKYRLLLEKDSGTARIDFMNDPQLQDLTRALRQLGYEWQLECTVPLKNQYDIRLKKQESSFLVGAASSGERELLTYLFAIYALKVRDALILVDEPELHLHPKWQRMLLQLFRDLARDTGNRFLLATHSPTFISPESIHYVSRVFSQEQKSNIIKLDASALPDAKHLLNIINSQNNERLFFADEVVLVEGISDRIFFEAWLDLHGRKDSTSKIVEVVSVGGKGVFPAYKKVLDAAGIPFSIIADRDYIEQVGTPGVKALFDLDTGEIKKDVVDNIKSLDGDALVQAIDTAIAGGSWTQAEEVWTYIKSRRRKLPSCLDEKQGEILDSFLKEKRKERVHILKLGALERYLPIGHAGKDLEKLIRFLAEEDFEKKMPPPAIEELRQISDAILKGPSVA
ncbi:AAA family ATPase [Stenotrophomonas oahuensis]|uniref:AAA family ATPase n=1 Tax=Stenotrophomonas oahuensis TaxID=3003271 RepID=A0ABY9YK26_9GAMM|nr:AAA family ATPase [Stenotrophomonas sp. A5586]WNH51236.1 AAA family ATPase [Stenotrophomonas sp. A5586]